MEVKKPKNSYHLYESRNVFIFIVARRAYLHTNLFSVLRLPSEFS